MSKKLLAITLGLCLVASALVGCAGTGSNADQGPKATGKFNWKRYKGKTVRLLFNEHPWTDGLKPLIPEFERLTGIKVRLQTFSEDLYFDKMEQAVRSTKPVADVYFLPMDDYAYNQFKSNLITPLSPMLDNSSLTSADYDLHDFPDQFLSPGEFTGSNGKKQLYVVPISFESYILFYNQDLVDRYLGGKVPTTMDQLIADSRKITAEGQGKVFGSVMRGIRSDTIRDTMTGVVLNEWDDSPSPLPYNIWFDGSWDKPRLDDARIVDGMRDYAELVKTGPSNRLSLDWPDTTALFAQGKAAFYIDASVFAPSFEDKSKSKVAGHVGYAQIPASSRGQKSGLWSWGLAIPANSDNKDAAWMFLQWATNRQQTARIGASTGGPPRTSALSGSATEGLNPDYRKTLSAAMKSARPTAVQKEGWKEGVMDLVDAMQSIARGGDPEQVMKEANDKMKAIAAP